MDCYGIMPTTLIINTFDPLDFEDQTEILCKNSQINLAVSSGFDSYLWNTGGTNNSISVNSAGDYLVTVKDANGCEKTKTFKVILSEPATITGVVVKDFLGSENTVSIEYTGVGNYEFSLDGNIFQNESVFTSVKPGIYNALSRDKNNCGVSNSFLFYVLDYPRFFTPNGDGYNDVWMIKNLNLFASFELSIFDRYGKLLKQINQNNSVWNGLYNAQILPADDYWFTLIYDEGRKINGNFSLKR